MSADGAISAWRIATRGARDGVAGLPKWHETDLDGAGAALSGARWNARDFRMVYAATNISLACLETVVHFAPFGLPITRYLVEILIPQDVWANAQAPAMAQLPKGWDARPRTMASVRYGTQWLQDARTALLIVPSVIVPQERNVLINPAHPDARRIQAVSRGVFEYDERVIDQHLRG